MSPETPQQSDDNSVPDKYEPAESNTYDYFVSFRRTGTLGISADAFKQHFEGYDLAAVYWDDDAEKIALKPTEKEAPNTYKLTQTDAGSGATILLTPWLKTNSRIPEETLQFQAEWTAEYNILEADLTTEPTVYGSSTDPENIEWVSEPVKNESD
jgi:hypothetical protein